MIRIENPHPTLGPRGFVFSRQNGVVVSKFDPGFPSIREVVDDRPGMHGTEDYSSNFGSRIVSMEFRIYPKWAGPGVQRRDIIDTINGLCNPRLRPIMYESIDNFPERRIQLRPDANSLVYDFPHTNVAQVSWVAPSGIWESAELVTSTIWPGGEGGNLLVGRTYDLEFDREYGERTPSTGTAVTNLGNIETQPVIIVYGPITGGFTIGHPDQEAYLVLPNEEVNAGDAIVFDFRRFTILKNNEPTQSRYEAVDWSQSKWFTLSPGDNRLSFNPTGFTDQTQMSVIHRHAWI